MTDSNEECNEDAWEYYDKVKDALNGLFEVLNVALEPENILYQCGVDNLEALKKGLLDLLMKDYDTLELQDTLRKIEFNVKKSLFFEDPKEEKSKEKVDEEKTI
ncbi:MAG: hypothetical protein ACW96X_04155 [Promethearchaeota archaeon]|jgi:hypothetical protein